MWHKAAHVVLLPDLLAYWLTGELRTEATNASTTGLLDVPHRRWSEEPADRSTSPPTSCPLSSTPGEVRGACYHACAARPG